MSKADAHNVILGSMLIVFIGLIIAKGWVSQVQDFIEKKVAS